MQVECPDCEQDRPVRIVAEPPLLAECQHCGGIFEVTLTPIRSGVRKSRPA